MLKSLKRYTPNSRSVTSAPSTPRNGEAQQSKATSEPTEFVDDQGRLVRIVYEYEQSDDATNVRDLERMREGYAQRKAAAAQAADQAAADARLRRETATPQNGGKSSSSRSSSLMRSESVPPESDTTNAVKWGPPNTSIPQFTHMYASDPEGSATNVQFAAPPPPETYSAASSLWQEDHPLRQTLGNPHRSPPSRPATAPKSISGRPRSSTAAQTADGEEVRYESTGIGFAPVPHPVINTPTHLQQAPADWIPPAGLRPPPPGRPWIVTKIVEKIVEVPVKEVVEKTVVRTVEKIVEVPVERIVEKVVEKIIEKIVEVPVQHVVEKVVQVPIERIKIVEIPVEANGEAESLHKRLDELVRENTELWEEVNRLRQLSKEQTAKTVVEVIVPVDQYGNRIESTGATPAHDREGQLLHGGSVSTRNSKQRASKHERVAW